MSYYFDKANWEVNTEGRGMEISPWVALAVAPILGGLFVVFLPFIGIAMFAQFVIGKLVNAVKELAHGVTAPVSVPGESHFTGSNSEIEKVADEISKRKNG